MCFSASASLTAGAGLLVIGAVAISQSKTTPQRFLASIPLIFSIQQFSEGALWLSLSGVISSPWQNISRYVFLAFAQVIWPGFVPLTILLFEKNVRRKQILRILLTVGILTSLYFSWCLLFYNSSAMIEGHHIKYELDFPLYNRWFSGIPYLLAAVMAPFISSLRPLRLLGVLLFVSYLVSRIFYQDYLVSVWCYFAAILSITILIIVRSLRKAENDHRSMRTV